MGNIAQRAFNKAHKPGAPKPNKELALLQSSSDSIESLKCLGVFSSTAAKYPLRVPELLDRVFPDMASQTFRDLAYSFPVSIRIVSPFKIVSG